MPEESPGAGIPERDLLHEIRDTLLLLDWSRRYAADGRALLLTALIFGLTHLGVACFGLTLRQGIFLTAASGAVMILPLRAAPELALVPRLGAGRCPAGQGPVFNWT